MNKLIAPLFGVLLAFLNVAPAVAAQTVSASAAPVIEKAASAGDRSTPGLIKTAYAASNREDGIGKGRNSSPLSATPSTSSTVERELEANPSRNGLSMLAALVILAGIVLRRFLR